MRQNDIDVITSHLLYQQLLPRDKAILCVLGGARPYWQAIDLDRQTAAEQAAIEMLTACEFVQLRIDLYVLFGPNQQTGKIQVQASGSGWGEQLEDALRRAGYSWGQPSILRYQIKEIKLSLNGETAQQNIDGKWIIVLQFVRGHGDQPPSAVPGWVVVESCSTATTSDVPPDHPHVAPVPAGVSSMSSAVDIRNWDEGAETLAEAIVARIAANKTQDAEPPSYLPASDLVKALGIPTNSRDAVEKRLARLRRKNAMSPDLYVESQNVAANQPRFLYNIQMVRPHLADLIPTDVSTVRRPS